MENRIHPQAHTHTHVKHQGRIWSELALCYTTTTRVQTRFDPLFKLVTFFLTRLIQAAFKTGPLRMSAICVCVCCCYCCCQLQSQKIEYTCLFLLFVTQTTVKEQLREKNKFLEGSNTNQDREGHNIHTAFLQWRAMGWLLLCSRYAVRGVCVRFESHIMVVCFILFHLLYSKHTVFFLQNILNRK